MTFDVRQRVARGGSRQHQEGDAGKPTPASRLRFGPRDIDVLGILAVTKLPGLGQCGPAEERREPGELIGTGGIDQDHPRHQRWMLSGERLSDQAAEGESNENVRRC